MDFQPLRSLSTHTFVLKDKNVDTDQIIPARFLTTTEHHGLGAGAFYDWRYDDDGAPRKDSPFAQYNPDEQQVLVAGANFGCGSSREHAPWALVDLGFRVVVSSDIADIFKSNALKNGLLAIEVDRKTHRRLLSENNEPIVVDLEKQFIRLADGWLAVFEVEPFARRCLLEGLDPLGALMAHMPAITAYEEKAA